MIGAATQRWLKMLGYTQAGDSLHLSADAVLGHPYGRELKALLDSNESVGASAVFDVEGLPTVCFIDATGRVHGGADWLDAVRQKIWNQNLVSLILVAERDGLRAIPARRESLEGPKLTESEASESGQYSIADIQSGDIQERHPDWFSLKGRVDHTLLNNLREAVKKLERIGIEREAAQFLLGQCIFVSFLEHREIVSDVYRENRKVGQLHELIRQRDGKRLARLFTRLKVDFNGDFLERADSPQAEWRSLSGDVFSLLDDFLAHVDLDTGQGSLWNYDFRYIPVELISGIYETFLSEERNKLGAHYTPRHLAALAIDQAFATSSDITKEVVYDGACGSGILLTSAFRRMLAAAERQRRRRLSFADRCAMLKDRIRGSDISRAACRVTAFSLYLSLLEDLKPSDISLLSDATNIKLPPLVGHTLEHRLLCGEKHGDFFSGQNRFTTQPDATIFIANPPWIEPSGADRNLTYEQWAKSAERFLPHRQIAAAFAHKATEAVLPAGRLCLILPAKLFLSPTSQYFIQQWLARVRVERLINFSDIRRLLFAEAVHPCVIVVGTVREGEDRGKIRSAEYIEYWTPKADIGLAFGRLTIHSTDRQRVLTQDIWHDNAVLRLRSWGSDHDDELIGRLRDLGTIGGLCKGKNARFAMRKGFHQTDSHVAEKKSINRFAKLPFLDTNDIPSNVPLLYPQSLKRFPKGEIPEVASYGTDNGAAFTGPRVLFPDGATTDFAVKTVFSCDDFCFRHTLAAICGTDHDKDLLRFLALFLRSKLVRYILLHTGYSLKAERPRVSEHEVKGLPFVLPEQHVNPKLAREIVRKATHAMRDLEHSSDLDRPHLYAKIQPELDNMVFEYFGITHADRILIEDATEFVIPSVQPSGYASIRTPFQALPGEKHLKAYCDTLSRELVRWRDKLGGKGAFHIEAFAHRPGRIGRVGIARITVDANGSEAHSPSTVTLDDDAVKRLIDTLRAKQILPLQAVENIYVASDFLIEAGNAMYLVKPLVHRLWMRSQALRDAFEVVNAVRYSTKSSEGAFNRD